MIEESCRTLIQEAAGSDVQMLAPDHWEFQLPESCESGDTWTLQLVARPTADGAFSATIYGRKNDETIAWHTIATAILTP